MKKERGFLLSLCVSSLLCVALVLLALTQGDAPTPSAPLLSGPTETLTASQFDSLLRAQPLAVTSANYVVQDITYKALYPDMLQAKVQNNSQGEITRLSVAFAAWDADGQPVAIAGRRDSVFPAYLRVVDYVDISVAPGGTFGEGYGYPVAEGRGIVSVKAVAVSYETSSGETWVNPYAPQWATLYEGVTCSEDMTVEVPIGDA